MPHASQDLAALRRCAQARGGVVSDGDLRACGFSAGSVRRRLLDGTWRRWGAIVIPGAAPEASRRERGRGGGLADLELGDLGQAWALQITYGPRAAISGALAMRRSGWRLPTSAAIVATPDKPRIGVTGIIVIRRQLGRVVLRSDGLRYVPAMEALLDACVTLDTARAADLLDAALQSRVISPESFSDAVEGRLGFGHRGARMLRMLRDRACTGSRSEAEQRMGRLLRRSGTGPWVANHPVRDESGRVMAEIDFALEHLRIAIEVDGRAHHSDRRAFEHDRERQNLLVVRGWLVLRFTWEQITQRPQEVLAAIDAAVRMRMAG